MRILIPTLLVLLLVACASGPSNFDIAMEWYYHCMNQAQAFEERGEWTKGQEQRELAQFWLEIAQQEHAAGLTRSTVSQAQNRAMLWDYYMSNREQRGAEPTTPREPRCVRQVDQAWRCY